MKKIFEYLKLKRNLLNELKKEQETKRNNNDVKQFYEDGLKISNACNGMVVIITNDSIIKEKATGKISHQVVAQEIIDLLFDYHIDFSSVDGDFGEYIPKIYNCVFIRMCSPLNGPTIIYYPEVMSDFQIEELIKFNNEIKEFNMAQKDIITFEYNGKEDEESKDLDGLIAKATNLENKKTN